MGGQAQMAGKGILVLCNGGLHLPGMAGAWGQRWRNLDGGEIAKLLFKQHGHEAPLSHELPPRAGIVHQPSLCCPFAQEAEDHVERQ